MKLHMHLAVVTEAWVVDSGDKITQEVGGEDKTYLVWTVLYVHLDGKCIHGHGGGDGESSLYTLDF